MNHIKEFLLESLSEDIGRGDLYSLLAPTRPLKAQIIAKSDGVFSGEIYLKELSNLLNFTLDSIFKDGAAFKSGDVLATLSGENLSILRAERVALNILAHSSGIATLTAEFVAIAKAANARVKLLDTRKTRPLLRALEKYSVRNGGGSNHRLGLDDMLMLKDTHLGDMFGASFKADSSADSNADSNANTLKDFLKIAREKLPLSVKIEVECESIESAQAAFEAGADIVMCDNMSVDAIKEVVAMRNAKFPHIFLEASGNLSRKNLPDYAKSGVDALSIGALIHQAVWVDLSMKVLEKH